MGKYILIISLMFLLISIPLVYPLTITLTPEDEYGVYRDISSEYYRETGDSQRVGDLIGILRRATQMYDLTNIQDSAEIYETNLSISFNYVPSAGYLNITNMTSINISAYSNDQTGNYNFFIAVDDENYWNGLLDPNLEWNNITLGDQADLDIQNRLSSNHFSMGFMGNETLDAVIKYLNYNTSSATTQNPYITLSYGTPTSGDWVCDGEEWVLDDGGRYIVNGNVEMINGCNITLRQNTELNITGYLDVYNQSTIWLYHDEGGRLNFNP